MPPFHYAANLRNAQGVAHAFFGRSGGVSGGIFESLNCRPGSSDVRENVIENRRLAVSALSENAKLVTLYQVHGNNAVNVSAPWEAANSRKADAMATNIAGIALGILTADCVPILLADSEARVISAAHAGWKGALSGVVESTIQAMESLGAKRERMAAAVGPSISQTNYEVGPELRARYLDESAANARFFAPGARDRFMFDLHGYVAQRLSAARVGSVERLALCTYDGEALFYSYRRATHRRQADCGRQLSTILLEP
jgi:YfiH family protein